MERYHETREGLQGRRGAGGEESVEKEVDEEGAEVFEEED